MLRFCFLLTFLIYCNSLSFLAFSGCSKESNLQQYANILKTTSEREKIDFLLNVGKEYYIQADPSFYEVIATDGEVVWDAYWKAMSAGSFNRIPRFVKTSHSSHRHNNAQHNHLFRKLKVGDTKLTMLQMDTK